MTSVDAIRIPNFTKWEILGNQFIPPKKKYLVLSRAWGGGQSNNCNFPENNFEMWTLTSAANWTVIIKCKNLAVYLRLTGPVSNSTRS